MSRVAEINDMAKTVGLPSEIEGKKVVGKLKLTRLEETILVEGDLTVGAILICDRCLNNFKTHIPITLEREYNLNRSKESTEDLYVDKLGNIDITEPVREEIILSVPMKNVCDEKCKGICPGCGVDLNKEDCKCKKANKK